MSDEKEPLKQLAHELPMMTILSDLSLKDAEGDALNMGSRLAVAYDILRHEKTQSPMTIAVYGDWGTGKTSAMRWLESQLKEWNGCSQTERDGHPCVYPVWFDPWKYTTREDVWRGIIAEVILATFQVKQLDRNNFRVRLTGAAKMFGAFLGKAFLHALYNINISVAGILKIERIPFDEMCKGYESVAHPEKAYLNQFEETLRAWIADFLKQDTENECGHRLVIFIDDLDRCLPEVTLEVLEAIKLYLAIKQILFVVGVDRDVVDCVVTTHYARHGIAKAKACQYLDKIFQVEIQITPSRSQVKTFREQQIDNINVITNGYWSRALAAEHRTILEHALDVMAQGNPREIKRLINSALVRGRAAVDMPRQDRDVSTDAPLFAQGIQVFLIHRRVNEIYRRKAVTWQNVLLDNESIAWFAEWSNFVIKYPKYSYSGKLGGDAPTNNIASKDAGITAISRKDTKPISEEDKAFGELSCKSLFNTEGEAIDKKYLFEDALIPKLLEIPFNEKVAKFTPETKDADVSPSHGNPSGRHVDAQVAALPAVIRDRIADQLNIPLENLTSADIAGIYKLNLSFAPLKNDDIKSLSGLTNLTELDLRHTPIADITPLAKLTNLTELDLSYTPISDITPLAKLTNLTELDLSYTPISDITPLANLTNLTGLHLDSTKVSDITPLENMTNLTELGLNHTPISDITPLAKLTNLTELDLRCIAASDITPLANLANLTGLSLIGTSVSDITPLRKLTNLTELDLSGTQVAKKAISELRQRLPNITIRT